VCMEMSSMSWEFRAEPRQTKTQRLIKGLDREALDLGLEHL